MATPRTLKGNTAFKGPRPWIDVTADGYNADPTGTNDCATAFNAAIVAAGSRGQVYIPPGSYKLTSTVSMANNVVVRGAGIRSTFLSYTGAATCVDFNGDQYAGLHGLTVSLGSETTAVGIRLHNNSTTSNASYNTLRDIEVWATSIVAGQVGLKVDSDSDGDATFNNFMNFKFYGVDKPVVTDDDEANVYVGFQIENFGSGASGSGVDYGGHADQFHGFWFGRGSSSATTLYGFSGDGDTGIIDCLADLGTGKIFNLTGNYNQTRGYYLGTTTYGDQTGALVTPLGRERDYSLSAYRLNVIDGSSADSNLIQFGIKDYSNGFTVAYDADPQKMVYQFNHGDVDITGGSLTVGNTHYIVLRGYYIWVDATGDLRIKSGAPSGETPDLDGTVVGTQS